MSWSAIDYEKLDNLRKGGWSWRTSVEGVALETEIMVDPATGKKYKLHVYEGELTMTEVSE